MKGYYFLNKVKTPTSCINCYSYCISVCPAKEKRVEFASMELLIRQNHWFGLDERLRVRKYCLILLFEKYFYVSVYFLLFSAAITTHHAHLT